MDVPPRSEWKSDLAPYIKPDARRSLGQIASCTLPYVGLWILASLINLPTWGLIALGLLATAMLVRMYSLFHDLTHGSLFPARKTNRAFGHLLGFFLFTPFSWWQRQHALHHANTGNLDNQGPGEITTITVAEYQARSLPRRLMYRAYRHPLLLLFIGPALVFFFARRFPQRGMNRRILASVIATNVALAAWVALWVTLMGVQAYIIMQGTTLIAGGAIAAWMLYIQHQYEEAYYQRSDQWKFEMAALQGSSYLKLPRVMCWIVGNANFHHVHHLSARIPNYNLRAAHESHPMFAQTPVIGFRKGMSSLSLKLWDEERQCMTGFPAMRSAQRREQIAPS